MLDISCDVDVIFLAPIKLPQMNAAMKGNAIFHEQKMLSKRVFKIAARIITVILLFSRQCMVQWRKAKKACGNKSIFANKSPYVYMAIMIEAM